MICFGVILNLFLALFLPLVMADYFINLPSIWMNNYEHIIPVSLKHPPVLIKFNFTEYNIFKSMVLLNTYSIVKWKISIPFQFNNTANLKVEMSKCKSQTKCTKNILFRKSYKMSFYPSIIRRDVFLSKSCYQSGKNITILIAIIRNKINAENQLIKGFSEKCRIQLFDDNLNKVYEIDINVYNDLTILHYKLPLSPKGLWLLKYSFNQNKFLEKNLIIEYDENINYLTDSNLLTLKVDFDNDVTFTSKLVKLRFCAAYSNIQSVVGKFSGKICLKFTQNPFNDEYYCKNFYILFKGSQLCYNKIILLNDLLKTLKLESKININTVISGKLVDRYRFIVKRVKMHGPQIRVYEFRIKLKSKAYFKPNLPYYGLLKLVKYNDEPITDGRWVNISCNIVNFVYKWGHYSEHKSDSEGYVKFILTNLPNKLRVVSCDIEEMPKNLSTNYSSGNLFVSRPFLTIAIEKWKSLGNVFLEIKKKNIQGNLLTVELQSNTELVDSDFHLMFVNQYGFIVKTMFFNRSHFNFSGLCSDREDEKGHFKCDKRSSNTIKCRANWSGNNCLSALCAKSCNHGICFQPNKCLCQFGWQGEFCDKCRTSRFCVNGYCNKGNDCLCFRGWSGINCDINNTNSESISNQHIIDGTKHNSTRSTDTKADMPPRLTLFIKTMTLDLPLFDNRLDLILHSIPDFIVSAELTLFNKTNFIQDLYYRNLDVLMPSPLSTSSSNLYLSEQFMLGEFASIDSNINEVITSTTDQLFRQIIRQQCIVPIYRYKRGQMPTQSPYLKHDRITHYDFLDLLTRHRILPISKQKFIYRNCPIWRFLELHPFYDTNPSLKLVMDNSQQIIKPNSDLSCTNQLHFSDKISSIDILPIKTGSSRLFFPNSTEIKIHYQPIFYVSLNQINYIFTGEIHNLFIDIFNQFTISTNNTIKPHYVINIKITQKTKFPSCLTTPLPNTIDVYVGNSLKSTVKLNMSFSCSGIFEYQVSFSVNLNHKQYKTFEAVTYRVYEGAFHNDYRSHLLCHQMKHITKRIEIPTTFSLGLELTMSKQSSYEYLYNYILHFYRHQTISNREELLLEIYKIKLKKMINPKAKINKSLYTIRGYLVVELHLNFNQSNNSTFHSFNATLYHLIICQNLPRYYFLPKFDFCSVVLMNLNKFNITMDNCFQYLTKLNPEISKYQKLLFSLIINNHSDLEYFNGIRRCLFPSGKEENPLAQLYLNSSVGIYEWYKKHRADNDLQLILSFILIKFQSNIDQITVDKILLDIVKDFTREMIDFNLYLNDIKIMLLMNLFYNFERKNLLGHDPLISDFNKLYFPINSSNILEYSVNIPAHNNCLVLEMNFRYFAKDTEQFTNINNNNNNNNNHDIGIIQSKSNIHQFQLSISHLKLNKLSQIKLEYPLNLWTISSCNFRQNQTSNKFSLETCRIFTSNNLVYGYFHLNFKLLNRQKCWHQPMNLEIVFERKRGHFVENLKNYFVEFQRRDGSKLVKLLTFNMSHQALGKEPNVKEISFMDHLCSKHSWVNLYFNRSRYYIENGDVVQHFIDIQSTHEYLLNEVGQLINLTQLIKSIFQLIEYPQCETWKLLRDIIIADNNNSNINRKLNDCIAITDINTVLTNELSSSLMCRGVLSAVDSSGQVIKSAKCGTCTKYLNKELKYDKLQKCSITFTSSDNEGATEAKVKLYYNNNNKLTDDSMSC